MADSLLATRSAVSDDEDDTHPNIDTPSLFRWRHQARLERDAAWAKEKAEFETQYKAFLQKYNTCQQKLAKAKESKSADLSELESQMKQLETEDKTWREKEAELKKKEKIINSAALKHEEPQPDTEESEEAAINRLKEFVKKHNKDIRKFGMFQKPIDSQNFLIEHPFLVCDETANQLVLWCIDLAMEEASLLHKFDLMNHVSHQCIVMQFMLELAKSLKCDPRSCIRPFFANVLVQVGHRPSTARVLRTNIPFDRLEEREKRLGPGGLDPVEVFESLPPNMKECFEKKDVEMLKTVLCSMDPKDAEYHMKRCVDSGLWVDNVNPEAGDEGDKAETANDEPDATGSTEQTNATA
ncbi:unnamed protein product [Echinostoma caproni]|uniref:Hsp90 chaperone protein kinase-targeting subunit n=1 Tax=Echinostoma caproni TaxID=27848 RepID=A0A183ALV9_9TREM|nr:unnamed protein product [Echinostoma caproni]